MVVANVIYSLYKWIQGSSSNCRTTVTVCGFLFRPQDNWIITQRISRMVNGTALQQVTVQVEFVMNTCNEENNCHRAFTIHKYETSTINATAARNISDYELVSRIVSRDGSGRENGSVNINFATEATGFYLGIQDVSSCIVIHRVLVFYYVCPAVTSNLISRPETTGPMIGASTPVEVVGQCVDNASPENVRPGLTCSQKGVWSVNSGAGCVCNPGFQPSSDGHSCEGMLSVVCLSACQCIHYFICLLSSEGCDPGMYLDTNDTCLPCPANSNSTQSGAFVCPCFEGYYRAAGDPPEMECTRKYYVPH